MDSDYIEQKIDCWNKTPCLLNLNKIDDIIEKFNKFARVTYVNDAIILKIQLLNQVKIACSVTNLRVDYIFYSLE